MKKILFIVPYIPYPLDSGGNQAFFNMVDHLRNTMEVSVLLNLEHEPQRNDVETLKKIWSNVTFYVFDKKNYIPTAPIYHIRQPWLYKLLEKIQASVTRKMRRRCRPVTPQTEDKPASADLVREKSTIFFSIFQELDHNYVEYVSNVSRQGFDIIQVEFYELLSLGYVLPTDTQTVFVHHELRYIRNEKEIELFQQVNVRDRALLAIARDYERAALLHFKHVVALTEVDRQLLVKFLGREERIYASPAVVLTKGRSELQFKPATQCRLTFVGSESHFPNLDAVNWFCREVAPYLRRNKTDFTFQVIGKWNGKHVKELQSICPEMELVGFVEDLAGYMQGSISVVPIRIGAGMRMKILDAVSSKVPFVTTSKGVEGLDLRDGSECLIADTAADFAKAIVKLTADVELQHNFVLNADKRLQQLYDVDKMFQQRELVYSAILSSKLNN